MTTPAEALSESLTEALGDHTIGSQGEHLAFALLEDVTRAGYTIVPTENLDRLRTAANAVEALPHAHKFSPLQRAAWAVLNSTTPQ